MVVSKELRGRAWESLRGKYGQAFLVTFIATIILSAGSAATSIFTGGQPNVSEVAATASISAIIGALITVFVGNPIAIGVKGYFIKNTDSKPEIAEMFNGFKNGYGNNVLTMFLVGIKVFLWTLLFIVPGIVKAYEYAMVPYLLAENPKLASSEAFLQSKKMMTGNKWRLFKLQFSFIGWILLCIITCGIGAFFLEPYMEAACAEFYKEMQKAVQPE